MASLENPSYFARMSGKSDNTLWTLRGFSFAVLVVLLLAMFVFKTGTRHDFCLGLGVGILIGLLAQLSAVKRVEVNDTTRPADVDNLSVTH